MTDKKRSIWEKLEKIKELLRLKQRRIDELEKENERLRKEIERQKDEIKGFLVKAIRIKPNVEEKKDRGKKLGPKFGHKAYKRIIPDKVDRELDIIPKYCQTCNRKLPYPHRWHSHVQVDLPPPVKPVVTKYNIGWCYCTSCMKEVSIRKGKLPYSKYGIILHLQICYWKFKLGLTLPKIQELLNDQYGVTISTGMLSEIITRSAKKLVNEYDNLKAQLSTQKSLNVDETGWRESGLNHWLWSFSNNHLSYYIVDKSRASAVVAGVLGKSFNGVLSTDFYGGYNKIESKKQRCWVHLMREMKELTTKYPDDKYLVYYKNRLKRFYKRGIALKESYNRGEDITSQHKRFETEFYNFVYYGYRNHKDIKRIAERLRRHRLELFTFIKEDTEPNNNNAEREIRPAVLMRKISYGNRSDNGSKSQAILMSMIRTSKKQGRSFLDFATPALLSN